MFCVHKSVASSVHYEYFHPFINIFKNFNLKSIYNVINYIIGI